MGLYRKVYIFFIGCHVSVLLAEEWKEIAKDAELQEKLKEFNGTEVTIVFKGVEVYEKYDRKKGWMTLVALGVESEDILNVRKNLGLNRKPDKLHLHCTMLEKLIIDDE